MSSETLALAAALHGTTAVNGGAQQILRGNRLPVDLDDGARHTAAGVAGRKRHALRPDNTPPAVSEPDGGDVNTGSASSWSTIAARYMVTPTVSGALPAAAVQAFPAEPPQSAFSQMSRTSVRLFSATRFASPNGAAAEPSA